MSTKCSLGLGGLDSDLVLDFLISAGLGLEGSGLRGLVTRLPFPIGGSLEPSHYL